MKPVLAVLSVAVVGFAVYGVLAGSTAVGFYVPITIVLIGVVALIHRSAGFSPGTLWALVSIAVGNLAGGVLLIGGDPLYEAVVVDPLRYDKIFHTYAAGVAAWAFHEALDRWAGRPGLYVALSAFLMASGAGALVEMVEYIGSLILENNSIGDYGNNMGDLVANTLGALAGASLAFRLRSAARTRLR